MITLKIETHDQETYTVEVEQYDPLALNEQINNQDINTLSIGELIISRINIKTIIPIEETEPVEP